MEGADAASTEFFGARTECPIPLEVLDFLNDFGQPELEDIWPCQARSYWIALQPFVRLVRFLLNYVTPFIIIIGVTLNVVSFGMLNTMAMSDSGLTLYLRSLVLSDNGALIFNYAVGVARSRSLYVNSMFMNNRFLCCANSISMEFFQFTSTWLVVCLTWARVAAVIFPLRIHNKCNNRPTVITIATLTCISFVVSLTKLYYGGYESDSVFEFVPCQKKTKPWGNAMYFYIAFSTWLPSLFIFIGNVLLVMRMRKSDVIRNQMTRTSGNTSSSTTNRTGRMLLAVSIVYLILLLPIGIVETLELYWDVILVKHPSKNHPEDNQRYISWLQEKMLLKWCRGFFFHVYHWNFAINFFLYYLTGKTFRDGVIGAFRNCSAKIASTTGLRLGCGNECAKIPRHFTRSRTLNISPIRVITIGERNP